MALEIHREIGALGKQATTPEIRSVRREFSRKLKDASARDVIGVAGHLLNDYGHRWVAYELIHVHPQALWSIGERELKQFSKGMASWGAVDTFAGYLAGPAWREKQIPDKVIHEWAHSDDRWFRRAALVSTVPLNMKSAGGLGDTRRTLRVCRMLVDDRDDMVVKAMSWALRALIRTDRKAVEDFLEKYDDRLAARVKREVTNKLTTGLKNPKRG
jgi:3-methyladenine DNA glycosylase AlkD